MSKKFFMFMSSVLTILLMYNIFALTAPSVFYPNTTGIRLNNGTEINWSASSDEDVVKYNLFYSNDSGINWFPIVYNMGYINYLNDSNTEENLTFSGNQNQTVYIDVPKLANITSAKINLTGLIIPPFTKTYDSFLDEDEGDDNANYGYDALSFGRFVTAEGTPIDLYFLIYSPPDANISKLELLLGGQGGTPESANITYNIYIAETDGYLSGDPIDDNTTAYTKIKSKFNMSAEWGDVNNVFVNISFDNSYVTDSSKKYLLWD